MTASLNGLCYERVKERVYVFFISAKYGKLGRPVEFHLAFFKEYWRPHSSMEDVTVQCHHD